MRLLPLAALLGLILLSGCASQAPYTAADLQQVKATYVQLLPVYEQFKADYTRKDGAALAVDFRREQGICRGVDVIDKRDSIDPNTNLFQASALLDGLCNTIESVYAWWQHQHHEHWDHSLVPNDPSVAFMGPDQGVEKMQGWLQRPAALTL
jgi:hypothetical protein